MTPTGGAIPSERPGWVGHAVLRGLGGDFPLQKGARFPEARNPGTPKVMASWPQMPCVRLCLRLRMALGHTRVPAASLPSVPPECVLLPGCMRPPQRATEHQILPPPSLGALAGS